MDDRSLRGPRLEPYDTVPREKTEVVSDELAAVERAVSMLGGNEVVVVLADDVGGVLDLLGRHQPRQQ